jgi:predicted amidohydrolase
VSKGSETKTYKAACAQFNIERARVAENLATAQASVQAAAEKGAQLVVLPEMWPTSFVAEPSVTLIRESREAERAMTRLSEELGIMIVGGGLEEEKGQFYNRALVADQGKVLCTYRKIHMFSPNAENRYTSPGRTPAIIDTRLGRIGVIICYDIRFPELTRYYFHQGVQVLTVPGQWPEARSDHWRTLVRARAIENEFFVVGCNRTGTEPSMRNEDDTLVFPGDSRIVNPMGEVIGKAQGENEPLIAEIELRRCRAMQRILPVHKDRQPKVYRDLWLKVWDNPDEPDAPEVPTIEKSTPTEG